MKKIISDNQGISDSMVETATGKQWNDWYTILDKAKATKRTHTEIARYLYMHHLENNGWWCQLIANRYEQVRFLRKKYQHPQQFTITVSKTLGMPITDVYEAWMDEKIRKKWLKEQGMDITMVIPNTSVGMQWHDNKTYVSVTFYEKGKAKSQVTIEHSKLEQEKDVDTQKKYWKKKLSKLSEYLAKR